jgi:hypothetical protein
MGLKKKLRIGLASAKRLPFEGPGSDARKERLPDLKQPALELSKRPAL